MKDSLKKLWQNIKVRRKKQLGLILILILTASITEVVSIGAVIPFLGILANPEAFFQHELACYIFLEIECRYTNPYFS